MPKSNETPLEVLEASIRPHIKERLQELFPSGKFKGNQFLVGDISGNAGESLAYNLDKNIWKDFAQDEYSGAGFVSLFAAKHGIPIKEAISRLSDNNTPRPPHNAPPPHYKGTLYCYHDRDGRPIMYVGRQNFGGGKKKFHQFCWESGSQTWIPKALTKERPLFNLPAVTKAPDILVVEGEKAALAAAKFAGVYTVTTPSGGCAAIAKTDWTPLKGKNILLWPDNDDPGRKAMEKIAQMLYAIGVKAIKILKTDDLPPAGDAANVDFKSFEDFSRWAKSDNRITVWEPPQNLIQSSPAQGVPAQGAGPGYTTNHTNNNPVPQENNARLWLLANFENRLFFNELSQQAEILSDKSEKLLVDDNMLTDLLMAAQEEILRLKHGVLQRALMSVVKRNSYNPFAEWLKSLPPWDKKLRLKDVFQESLDVPEDPMLQELGPIFFTAIVLRGTSRSADGVKFHLIPVLIGDQGTGKSTWCESILPCLQWFTDSIEFSGGDSKFVRSIIGKILGEAAEFCGSKKAESDVWKNRISRQVDRYRRLYTDFPESHPRRCIIVGTANNDKVGILPHDSTGYRRYCPIYVSNKLTPRKVREYWEENREQIFAEALHYSQDPDFQLYFSPAAEKTQRAATESAAIKSDYSELAEFLREEIPQILAANPDGFRVAEAFLHTDGTPKFPEIPRHGNIIRTIRTEIAGLGEYDEKKRHCSNKGKRRLLWNKIGYKREK